MQLDEYAKVTAGRLSGGNKRKLCVSMALIGNPKLMFFD
jgi:ATP-binding cassette subfamily A (ABC1) protein 3